MWSVFEIEEKLGSYKISFNFLKILPLVPGPELAILRIPLIECLISKFSSSNLAP